MELSEHQKAAVEALRPHRLARLVGAAGTGKSTVAVRLPELLGLGERVVFATPSHTARRVLEWKAAAEGIEIRTVTTASLLWGPPRIKHCRACPPKERGAEEGCPCLRLSGSGCPYRGEPGQDYCGEQEYGSAGVGSKPFWRDWDSVIVDESSMVQRKDYDALMAGRDRLAGRLIFTGDVCQLPAVGGAREWSALTEPMPEAKLTEVRRTDAGPIVAGAAHLRRVIDPLPGEEPAYGGTAEHFAAVAAQHATPDSTTAVFDAPTDPEQVRALLAAFGNAGQDFTDWQGFAVLVHGHRERIAWNAAARRVACRGPAPEVGDVLMASSNIDVKGGPLVTKWSRGVVLDVRPGAPGCNLPPAGQYAKRAPHSSCFMVDISLPAYGDGVTIEQHVTTEWLNHRDPNDGRTPGWLWGYAMTVHASQGDAFDHVVLHDSSPLARARSTGEPLADPRRVYTAVTRARKSVTVVPSGSPVPSVSW